MILSLLVGVTAFFSALVLLTLSSVDADVRLFWRLEEMSNDQVRASPEQLHEFATLVRASATDPDLVLFAKREIQRSEILMSMHAKHLTVPDREWEAMPFSLLARWNSAIRPLMNPYGVYQETRYYTARSNCLQKFSLRSGNVAKFAASVFAAVAAFLMVHIFHSLRMQRVRSRGQSPGHR